MRETLADQEKVQGRLSRDDKVYYCNIYGYISMMYELYGDLYSL